jgi:hypothetical protein
MDHDQEKMRMGTECVGCNIVRREEISDIVRRSWGWGEREGMKFGNQLAQF